ncbi:flagellar basal body-associated protein FliL [Indiicoccus explosivorum]|uniref:flagellar basal body-associated protein FliL n=1 Tax=Indiicoccus explosivorum TaxID=1917864 RepID=UPI000B4366A7|nr:flagellar basal body-associated protein FliL [Indiicoccus explosivorum]
MKNKVLGVLMIMLVSIALIGVVVVILVNQLTGEAAGAEPSIEEVAEASVDVPEMTTNLKDGNFIRLSLKVQGSSKDAAEELELRMFQINNLIISELSEKSAEELNGKEGKLAFQEALKAQLNELMQKGEVEKVYLTSYLIQ